MSKKATRILIASTLADFIAPLLAERYETVVVAHDAVELDARRAGALRFDVVISDLLWNDFALEWEYDGLDALAQLEKPVPAPAVIVAAQGHSFERDHLQEAVRNPLVAGFVLKGGGLRPLFEAIDEVAVGGRYWHSGLPDELRAPTLTTDGFLTRSDLGAHVAGAIAAGLARDWTHMHEVVPYEKNTIEGVTKVFAAGLYEMGEVGAHHEVNQAVIFRWCGEHARYIVGWCRRHGMGQYRRVTHLPARPDG